MAGSGAGKSAVLTSLAGVAITTGLSLGELAELDFGQLEEVHHLAEAERQRQQWTNDTELLAGILEQLRSLTAVIQSGIPTVQVRKLRGAKQPKPIDRPSWLAKASDGVATVRPAEFFHMMKA